MSDSYLSITEETITAAKMPPAKRPYLSGDTLYGYKTDYTVSTNKLRGLQFKFAYRHIFDDKEKSIFSPFSEVLIPQLEETIGGFFVDDVNLNNRIDIGLNTGSDLVEKIELAVKIGELGTWQSYVILDKSDLGITNNSMHIYNFYNNIATTVIDQDSVNKSTNYSPRVAECQEFLPTNQLAYGRLKEGFDNVKVDASVSVSTSVIGYESKFIPFERSYGVGYIWKLDANYKRFSVDYVILKLPEVNYTDRTYVVQINKPDGTYERIELTSDLATPESYPKGLRDIFLSNISSAFNWEVDGYEFYYDTNSKDLMTNKDNEYANVVTCPDDRSIILPLSATFRLTPFNTTIFLEGAIGTVIDSQEIIPFKKRTFTRGKYKKGLVYKDKYGRRSPVQTSESLSIDISGDEYDGGDSITPDVHVTDLDWEINHLPPIESYYYQWVITSNLEYSNYFMWAIDNVEEYDNLGFSFVKIGIQKSILNNIEINNKLNIEAYQFTKNDYIRRIGVYNETLKEWEAIDDNSNYEIIGTEYRTDKTTLEYNLNSDDEYVTVEVPVEDVEGNAIPSDGSQVLVVKYTKTDSVSGGDLFAGNILINIVTPTKEFSEDFYHEVGPVYEIGDPGLDTRYHKGDTQDQVIDALISTSPAKGTTTDGDSVLRARYDLAKGLDFLCIDESVSEYYDSKDNSYGKVAVEDSDSEQKTFNIIRHSGKYFDNTNINDLSSFNFDDYITIDDQFGAISRIIQVGDTLKVYQPLKSTSVYIGKSFVKQADGTDQVMTVDKTFGVTIPSSLDYGCKLAGSVLRNERYVYFFDIYAAAFLRDAPNGLVPVSENLMDGYFKAKSKALLLSGIENIKVLTGYDDENGLVYLSFVDSITPANNETLAYHEKSNRWITFLSFIPDMYANFGSTVLTTKESGIYIHNSDNVVRCNFYGEKYPRNFLVYSNKGPNFVKTFLSMSIFTNRKGWSAPEITIDSTSTYARGMISRLKSGKFKYKEGVAHAAFMRNMLTKSNTIDVTQLAQGEELRGEVIGILLQESNDEKTVLFEIDVNFIES